MLYYVGLWLCLSACLAPPEQGVACWWATVAKLVDHQAAHFLVSLSRPYKDDQDRLLWKDTTCPART